MRKIFNSLIRYYSYQLISNNIWNIRYLFQYLFSANLLALISCFSLWHMVMFGRDKIMILMTDYIIIKV